MPYTVARGIAFIYRKDLNRQIVKSEFATVRFEELDFEIPPNSQRGVLSTVDGLLDRAIDGLNQQQEKRLVEHPDLHSKIEGIVVLLKEYYDCKTPFTLIIDDPTGNSYIENLNAPSKDPKVTTRLYWRTKEQNEEIGLPVEDNTGKEDEIDESEGEEFAIENQVHVFPGNCSRCNVPSETKMHMLDIPHFKEVIVMATHCDSCGFKSNEIKAGGAVSEQGQTISLIMTEIDDLSRDILKSESCALSIPEIALELSTGTLGGRFTTVEGLLSQVFDELEGRSQFMTGDSSTDSSKNQFKTFLDKLKSVLTGEAFPVTLVLKDPLANSHLQNPYAPDKDPNMSIEWFDRTYEDNEDYGLNDINVDDY